jgi:hypothetical protein
MKNNNVSAGFADINTFSAFGGRNNKGELSEFPLIPPRGLEFIFAFLCTNGEKRANKKLSIRAGRPAGFAPNATAVVSPLGRLNYRQCAAVSRAARSTAVCVRPRGGQVGEGVVPRPWKNGCWAVEINKKKKGNDVVSGFQISIN